MGNPTSIHLAQVDHLRTVINSSTDIGLVLDPQTFEEYAQRGWSRSELQRAVDALLKSGEASIQSENGRMVVYAETPTEVSL